MRNVAAHQESRKLIDHFGILAFEDLNAHGMLKNHCLAKSIADAAWNQYDRVMVISPAAHSVKERSQFVQNEKILPLWAPRVRQDHIRRMYENDARGIHDPDLIDEVGYALLSRCQSFLDATAAVQGRAPCPVCNRIVHHNRKRETLLHCECGWMLTWEDYFATIQHKQLSGAEPVVQLFEQFVSRFPTAHTPRDKVILIDQLLHGFHWYHQHGYTRPVAVNLIGGRLAEVIVFLDSLTYGPASTPGTQETFAEWKHNSRNVRRWALTDQQASAE